MVAPKGSLEIHEEAWNAYPYCKTVLSNPGYMKVNGDFFIQRVLKRQTGLERFIVCFGQDNFYIIVETYHLPDRGDQANVHELEDKKLKKRSVVHIDIANDPVASADYKPDQDPKTFKSDKTGRGPLTGEWRVSEF